MRSRDKLPEITRLVFGSIYGAKTQKGLVEMIVNDYKVQMDLDKAREVLGLLSGAIEAAISDELMIRFLTGPKVGLPIEAAAAALLDFRELRQGSREVIFPS